MNQRLPFVVAVMLSATVYLSTAHAADWPGFRGPTGSGVSAEKDLPLPDKDGTLWKIKLPGPGASGPIAAGDKLFVTCYTGYGAKVSGGFGKGGFGKGGKGDFGKGGFGKGFGKPDPAELKEQEKLRFILLCVDAKKGDIVWQKEVEPKLPEVVFGGMIREHGYATSTPVTDGERVYAFFGKTGVVAFDMEGKQLWHTSVGTGTNFFGMASSPVLYKDLVIVNASIEGGELVALEAKTGKKAWRAKVTGLSWGSPVLVETDKGKTELVVSMPDKIIGFDPQTGDELWHCKGIKTGGGGFGGFGGGKGEAGGGGFGGGGFGKGGGGFGGGGYGGTYSTPAAHKGVVYVAGGGGFAGSPTALAVRAGGRGDVEESHVVWREKAGTTYSSPIVLGEHVYFVDGSVTCLRADNGKQVYKERLYESRGEYVSPVAVGDKLVVLTRFDGMFIVAAGKKFEQLAAHEFAEDKSIFNAGPAIAGGRIYARSNEYLYCIGKK
jgi:outer membrane protein assembly factor BamB